MAKIHLIAALGKNRVLGNHNGLLWRIPDDLKRFREFTTGHPIVMGRKTFESIGRTLPNRTNIVITRNLDWKFDGVVTATSLDEAIEKAAALDQEIFIIGGGEIYTQALPRADILHLTLIEDEKEGDTFFPEYEKEFMKKISEEHREFEGLKYKWVTLERV